MIMAKEIEIGKPVIVPEFSTWHIYAGPNADSDGITYDLATRWVHAAPEAVAPVEALTRYHEEAAKSYVHKNNSQSAGSPFLWQGTLLTPTGHARMTVHASTRSEARARWARMQAIIDWHTPDEED